MTEKERLEAEERGELPPTPPAPTPTLDPSGLSLEDVSADSLVEDDTDRPKADNKLPPPPGAGSENAPSGEAPNVNPPAGKKRGRKPMTEEEKAQAKQIRDAIKAGKPAPNFANLPGASSGGPSNGATVTARPPRDYYLEACNIFFPVSMFAGKVLGEHWGIPIKEKEINGLKQMALEPTDEQKQYLANMARWLEYEQFPEVNARWAFIISSVGYIAPKAKTSPTPEVFARGWEWIRRKVLRLEPNHKIKLDSDREGA